MYQSLPVQLNSLMVKTKKNWTHHIPVPSKLSNEVQSYHDSQY